jgi:hypothetical protein
LNYFNIFVFVLVPYFRLSGARVLELGAGMSGLAGLLLASHCASPSASSAAPPPSCIVLTDGNPISVRHLEHNVRLNRTDASAPASADSVEAVADVAPPAYPPPTADCDLRHVGRCGATAMGVGTLVWNRAADYSALGKFDFILVADWCGGFFACH